MFTSKNLFWWNEKSCIRIIFLSLQNELSDANKTYIDVSNGQKFDLVLLKMKLEMRLSNDYAYKNAQTNNIGEKK